MCVPVPVAWRKSGSQRPCQSPHSDGSASSMDLPQELERRSLKPHTHLARPHCTCTQLASFFHRRFGARGAGGKSPIAQQLRASLERRREQQHGSPERAAERSRDNSPRPSPMGAGRGHGKLTRRSRTCMSETGVAARGEYTRLSRACGEGLWDGAGYADAL